MKNFVFILLTFCMIFFVTACNRTEENLLTDIQTRDKIIIGVRSDAKPFGYIDSENKFAGFDIDLAKLIAKYLLGSESKVEFVPVTASNRIISLTSEKVDIVIATMTVTEQRKSILKFSTPYFITGQAVMVQRNSGIRSINDLNDKRVIVVLGSTAEKNIKFFAPKARIQGYKTNTDAYQALLNKQGEALTTDDTILMGFAMTNHNVKILSKRYTQEPYAIAFRQDSASESLRNNVNFILERIKLSGELDKINDKWIKY